MATDYPLWYPQTFLITPFGFILRLFWLLPLVSSDISDYPLWYPPTFLITPFGILRFFWLPPVVSSDFSDYPFGILRLFWLPPLVSSDFSDYPFGILRLILLSSEVDTVEWLCTFQFWDLSAQLFLHILTLRRPCAITIFIINTLETYPAQIRTSVSVMLTLLIWLVNVTIKCFVILIKCSRVMACS